jgi:hypothetical protein
MIERESSLRRADWPVADRRALDQALTPDEDGSGECGAALHLRAATLEGYVLTYGQWLSFLARSVAFDPAAGPAERATPEYQARTRAQREKISRLLEDMKQRMGPGRQR